MREYFLESKRIGFSLWKTNDLDLAKLLWSSPDVTKYISGSFNSKQIQVRLQMNLYGVQYFPIFDLRNAQLIGCCRLRPNDTSANHFELGIHLRK